MSAERARIETLGGELEPNILPRQRRELERLGASLEAERPAPPPALRARLAPLLDELRSGSGIARLPAWALVAAGLAVLLVAAVLALR